MSCTALTSKLVKLFLTIFSLPLLFIFGVFSIYLTSEKKNFPDLWNDTKIFTLYFSILEKRDPIVLVWPPTGQHAILVWIMNFVIFAGLVSSILHNVNFLRAEFLANIAVRDKQFFYLSSWIRGINKKFIALVSKTHKQKWSQREMNFYLIHPFTQIL